MKRIALVHYISLYKGITLDSSWELELAKRLDDLNIKWNRPDPLKWKDSNGLEHNYFPDFYLVDHNLYLDPKNPGAYKVDLFRIFFKNIVDARIKCGKMIIVRSQQ